MAIKFRYIFRKDGKTTIKYMYANSLESAREWANNFSKYYGEIVSEQICA